MTGQQLIDLGYTPGKWFGEVIEHFKNNNVSEEEIIPTVERFKPKFESVLIPREIPLEYSKFIDAESEEELMNLISVEQSMDIVMKTPTVVSGAIMPDACPVGSSGHIPVGGVAVAKNAIHPAMHSADICCSVMITGYGNVDPVKVLDRIHKVTDFGSGPRRTPGKFLPSGDLLDRMRSNRFFSEKALAMAISHLGTQGDGNHFAFVGKSKNTGETCLVTHHGSRGVGAQLYKAGMQCAEKWKKRLCPSLININAWIPFETEDGQLYWEALQMVREWTKMNHEVLHHKVREKFNYHSKTHFWNEHNFVFKKGDMFYHAKGSTPMDDFIPDNKTGLRLIPLNMREPVLVVSRNEKNTFGFAPHGAGRNLSRSQFLKKEIDLEKEIEGLDVRFYSGNPDKSELPSAYKNAEEVKRQILKYNLANIEDEIIPYGCIMSGESNFKRF